ncbi:sulfate permease family inorganic anion transporter domain protein [Mycobacterium ulcerans str. Harvey]|uniref:Sulfate permease family inorganic anion transporter domain protein n=1 Tax=Mycobacterium ulcerans str. Harvey TaxID=1299332 RepID=A0ABP3ANC6_MYCUL|nr:sulfate permease family inorganic anion transporter domain protein [Mycobacterium ulcerans str. Harvey]
MIPPTTAAINPASTGASEAMAMPNDNGSATRKTTSEAGKSCLMTDRTRSGRDICDTRDNRDVVGGSGVPGCWA